MADRQGKHVLQFALMPYEAAWPEARVPQAAWEYNLAPVLFSGCAVAERSSYLETSSNVIVNRFGERATHRTAISGGLRQSWRGTRKLLLPHKGAALTDLAGRHQRSYAEGRSTDWRYDHSRL